MEKKELQEFLHFLTHNKGLTRARQLKRDALLSRDLCEIQKSYDDSHISSSASIDKDYTMFHSPSTIVSFLHQFTEQKTLALKYTSHYWDRNSEGIYPYSGFRDFKENYLKILNDKEGRPLSEIEPLCQHLWMTIKNFLVNDDGKYPWSDYKLRIGYNHYLEKWMDSNPDKQPFSMPLSELPDEMKPKSLINGKTLVYFGDVVEIFKHCIEFRDNDLFFEVLRIFKESSDHRIDMALLSSLRGRTFYTDTELVKDALRIIASNIFQRSEYPELQICCKLKGEDGKEIELRIMQVGSFSNKDVNDPKILANSSDGDMARIREKLRNLCDFSVESLFRVNEELQHCRINYLSTNESQNKVDIITDEECSGFSYVLTFHTYNHE